MTEHSSRNEERELGFVIATVYNTGLKYKSLKYARIRVFSDSGFPIERENLRRNTGHTNSVFWDILRSINKDSLLNNDAKF